MTSSRRDAVTGSFGFTGRALTEALLARGRDVVTLSRRSSADDPLAARIDVRPLRFDRTGELVEALRGVDTLYNTYWLRFPRGTATYERAVADSAALIGAARRAGVRRLVQVSVVNAAQDGPTPYVRAKAALEAVVRGSGLEWSIVRPTLAFGEGDILLNNLAWALRRLPVYGLPGFGRYRVQPVHVQDVARICVEASDQPPGQRIDAGGPEVLAYRDLVDKIRVAVRSRSLVVPMPHLVVLAAARALGLVVRDVVLTRDEITELTSSFLVSRASPRGTVSVSEWIAANGSSLGRRWSSELARNYQT